MRPSKTLYGAFRVKRDFCVPQIPSEVRGPKQRIADQASFSTPRGERVALRWRDARHPDTIRTARNGRRGQCAARFLAWRERGHAQPRPLCTGGVSMASTHRWPRLGTVATNLASLPPASPDHPDYVIPILHLIADVGIRSQTNRGEPAVAPEASRRNLVFGWTLPRSRP
jgi:hypothetical protein